MAELAVCADFGSTFTKVLLVDLTPGRTLGQVIAGAEHRTTIDTDVLDGYDACLAELARADPRVADAEVLACSSAGGGLRVAVVGNEELVTAEAGRRVALSSGGKVVTVRAVAQGDDLDVADAQPDVVLLTGGTDGGNPEPAVVAARGLVASGWHGPTVVACNIDALADVNLILGEVPHILAQNVVPQIGAFAPASARAAIREVFLAHVIGGKHLSSRADFTRMVRGATPDVVLTGVEVLAAVAGEVVVVDIGGATTDVHSVVEVDPEQAGLAREVIAPAPVTRTVEGDLGMRWSAMSTVDEAGLPDLDEAARKRHADPGFLPSTEQEHAEDEAIARAAVALALRRHAGRSKVVVSPEGRVIERTGVDLREVGLVVGSGGVLRHGHAGVAERVLGPSVGPDREQSGDWQRLPERDRKVFRDGDWQLPERARVVVDSDYVLAAAGLLAAEHPDAAYRLVTSLLDGSWID